MNIKDELIKRLDDHGYKLDNEGKIVVKFSTCEDDNLRIVTVEKFTIEIGDDWISFRKEKGFKGKLLLDVTFEKFVESSDFYIPRMIDQFEESHADVIEEILNLIYSTLDECIHLSKSDNTPDKYPTQSKKDVIERELQNGGWSESEGVFCFGNLDFKIYDDDLEITSDRKQMIILYDDLVQNASQCINDIGLSFDIPQLDFSTFIEDLASIIQEMSIKTKVQNEIPNRYQTQSGKNLIEILKSEMLTHEEYIGFLKGNVYKYIFRYQKKNGKDDLKKAKHYLDLLEAEIDE